MKKESSEPSLAPSFEVEGLVYALDRLPKKNGRRSIVSVKVAGKDDRPLVDRVDLYSFRSRQAFAGVVAERFGRQAQDVLGHLAFVLDEIERQEAKDNKPSVPVLTVGRTKSAEKLLRARDLLDRVVHALDDLGYVGEERNKKLVYLVATSRLLAKPLSAILRAPSGSGKSELLDKLALLLPEESVEFLSRLTPSALYYLGPDALRHKVVLVDEQAGASEADYPIRTLQSKGFLRLAATAKGKTESFTVNGPIALLSGTTHDDLNPENLSRCLELLLDDSQDQTRRVQDAQRRQWAGERSKAIDGEVWKDAQRLLEPLEVVIPFARKLTFPARTTKDRRDNQKLLTLIASHALLHQRQRKKDKLSRVIATLSDYRAIYDLVRAVVEQEIEDLSPRAATLYRALLKAERTPVSRREAASLLGWSYMTAKRALTELLHHELVAITDREFVKSYVVIEAGVLGRSSLIPPSRLRTSPQARRDRA